MVTLLLGKLSHSVHKLESLPKVGKLECLRDVALLDNVSTAHLLLQGDESLTACEISSYADKAHLVQYLWEASNFVSRGSMGPLSP
jgi:hypothetical protein